MNSYELTVILRNKELDNLKARLGEILQKHGVNIIRDESWGMKRLAYEIDREREGFYFFAQVEANPESIQKILADFKLNVDFLRYLFVKKEAKSA